MTKKKSKSQKKHRQVESKKVKKPSISLTSSLKKFFSSRSGGIVLNLSLLLISLSVLFIILEVGARIIIKPDLDKWFVGPSYDFEKWNDAHGIHGAQYRESSIYFYTNRINILGLGDSFTFASGVYDFEKTHLKLLENKLISRGIPSGINNVAYPGNNILDIVESARKHISLVKPDIVLYSIVLNDPTNKAEQKPEPLQINLFPYICKSLEKHSYFYFYINSKFKSLIQGIFYPEHTKNFYDRLFTNENLRLYENQLVGLKSLAERNNAELIAIILPVMDNFENYQFMDHHKKLEEILDNNSITYVDLLPRFLSVEDTRSLWVNPYDSHPNDIAQEIIAEGAAVFLSKHIRENYSDKLSSLPAEGKKQLFHSDATFKVAPEGRRLISEGKFEEAIRIFKRSLQNEPDNFLLYHWIARCHINKGDIDEGIRHLENCISISPEYADAYVLLSEAYQLKKMNSRAKECLNAALKIIPDEAEIYYELSMILEKEEDYSGALDMIKKAVELEPNDLDYRFQLAAMKMNNSDVEEAIGMLDNILRIDPNYTDASRNLVHAYYLLKDYDKAIESGNEILNQNPNNVYVLFRLGNSYYKLNSFNDAAIYYERLLKIQPTHAEAHMNLSFTYFRLKKYDLAWKELRLGESNGITIPQDYFNVLSSTYPEPKDKK